MTMVQEIMPDRMLARAGVLPNNSEAVRRVSRISQPTPKQLNAIVVMLTKLRTHNPQVWESAAPFIDRHFDTLTFAQASETIGRLKAHLNAPGVQVQVDPPASYAEVNKLLEHVPDGRYAVNRDGKVHFFVIKLAHPKATFRVVREKASDELHKMYPNQQAGALREIIQFGLENAGMLYADTLGECRRCGRDLTDTDNSYKAYGYGPDCGPKVMG
jgi:hypothetical protein